jgi:hypothetical protein
MGPADFDGRIDPGIAHTNASHTEHAKNNHGLLARVVAGLTNSAILTTPRLSWLDST